MRAVSIGAVILGHLTDTRGYHFPQPPLGDVANLGVRVFFVISGFLITSLLVAEVQKTGGVSLSRFFARRSLRIFPAAFFFLAVVAIAGLAFRLFPIHPWDLFLAATYTINYSSTKPWVLGHLWSLAVEEQFYLLWPAVIALSGLRRAMHVAVAVVLVAPVLRVAWLVLWPEHENLISKAFPTVADTIALGCVLALAHAFLGRFAPYLRILGARWTGAALILATIGLNMAADKRAFDYPVGQTLRNVTIALFIDRCVRFPGTPIGRFLNTRLLVLVGTLSYSIYLWQQVFLNRGSAAWICAFPQNLILALAAGAISHLAIEKPGLAMRDRLVRRRAAAVTAV